MVQLTQQNNPILIDLTQVAQININQQTNIELQQATLRFSTQQDQFASDTNNNGSATLAIKTDAQGAVYLSANASLSQLLIETGEVHLFGDISSNNKLMLVADHIINNNSLEQIQLSSPTLQLAGKFDLSASGLAYQLLVSDSIMAIGDLDLQHVQLIAMNNIDTGMQQGENE